MNMSEKLKRIDRFDTIIENTEVNNKVPDIIVSVIFALMPLLAYYQGFKSSLSITLIIVCCVYLSVRFFLTKKNLNAIVSIIILCVYEIYKAISWGGLYFYGRGLLMCVVYVFLATKVINKYYVLKAGLIISLLASLVLLVQYFTYYILGFHLTVVPTVFLLPENEQWVALAHTGIISVTGNPSSFYRPSAFFLEPSHFFFYVFPFVLFTLFSKGKSKWKFTVAAILSVGILLSTSGMGLVFVAGAWCVYFCFTDGQENNLRFCNLFLSKKHFFLCVAKCFGVMAVILISPCAINSIMRILGLGGSSSAISGRSHGYEMIPYMNLQQLIFGYRRHLKFAYSSTGFFSSLFKFGFVGVLLAFGYYIQGAFACKRQYRYLCILLLILSFFAIHPVSAFSLCVYVSMLSLGYEEQGIPDYFGKIKEKIAKGNKA